MVRRGEEEHGMGATATDHSISTPGAVSKIGEMTAA